MAERLRIPGEWELHAACWMAFPHLPDEWSDLGRAQRALAALCRAITERGNEDVRLLVADAGVERLARSLIGESNRVTYLHAHYGDVWTRDTLPTLGRVGDDELGALCFEFNGWGGKFEMAGDESIGDWVVSELQARAFRSPVILEGGAIESNGDGVLLTTESCALHPNRNPDLSREALEASLRDLLDLERVVWLRDGLAGDHTDGHIDMLARFANDETVLCMRANDEAPNAGVLRRVHETLLEAGFRVRELPAPDLVLGPDGSPLPASYCNFYVANEAVIVPTYGASQDELALAAIGEAFPERALVGLPATDLLCGGGAFHCVTQPQPSLP
mgnify:CR=1 FL=1